MVARIGSTELRDVGKAAGAEEVMSGSPPLTARAEKVSCVDAGRGGGGKGGRGGRVGCVEAV